jgi:hypothetical protein
MDARNSETEIVSNRIIGVNSPEAVCPRRCQAVQFLDATHYASKAQKMVGPFFFRLKM